MSLGDQDGPEAMTVAGRGVRQQPWEVLQEAIVLQ